MITDDMLESWDGTMPHKETQILSVILTQDEIGVLLEALAEHSANANDYQHRVIAKRIHEFVLLSIRRR